MDATYLSQLENGYRGVCWANVMRMLRALDLDITPTSPREHPPADRRSRTTQRSQRTQLGSQGHVHTGPDFPRCPWWPVPRHSVIIARKPVELKKAKGRPFLRSAPFTKRSNPG